jgi:hypothetical protein
VLDALDECRELDCNILVRKLATFYNNAHPAFLSESGKQGRGRLKFLVTCRPYEDIRLLFKDIPCNLPCIRLRGEEENDTINHEINLVIKSRVTKLAEDLELKSELKNKLEDKLLNLEHRTYLWLHLSINNIYDTYRNSFRPEEEVVESLPSTVEDAYEKILSRIAGTQRSRVKQILQIVVGARRPLTIEEMAIALGISASSQLESLDKTRLDKTWLKNNISHWCGLFVFINHSKIYLIHQTAKEFLIRAKGLEAPMSGWKHCLHPTDIEKSMAHICVEFLCLRDITPTAQSLVDRINQCKDMDDVFDEINEVESFLVYAANHWHRHVRDANLPANTAEFGKISSLYDTTSQLYHQWFRIYWKRLSYWRNDPPQMNDLQLASFLGHLQILRLIASSESHHNVDLVDSHGLTALRRASEASRGQ